MSESPDSPSPDSRLRSQDPALSMPDPRIDEIRAKVLAGAEAVPITSARSAKRRRRAYLVGGVAAGVALLAGTAVAGAAVGRVTAPTTDVVAASDQVATADSIPAVNAAPTTNAAAPNMPSVGRPGSAANNPGPDGTAPNVTAPMAGTEALGAPATATSGGGAAMAAGADAKMAYPFWGGWGTTFVPAADLADEPGTATGYRLVSAGVDGKALAAQLGRTLGVKGQPKDMDGAWMIGSEDGSAPSVWVSADSMVSWSYSDPTQNPWECAVSATPVPDDGSGSTDAVPPEACQPTQKPMDDRDALKETRRILSELGVTDASVSGVDIEWETASDDYTTTVTAWQRVDGARTQLSWNFSYGAKDLLWASGFAAGLEPVPDMPIVGAATAVNRSQDPRWASFGPSLVNGGVMPMAAEAKSSTSAASSPSAVSSPSAAATSIKVQVVWDPVTVTGAEPTLAQYWQQDGTMLLLPAYSLTTANDRGDWVVIALDESAVSFVAPQ